jgi:Fur family ferric uptake transcriptional regulator
MPSESRIERICHDKGLKMTEQRRVIARVLSDAHDHPDVEEVHRRAHALDPRISIATVYRTVRLFEEANIIERHEFRDGRARYEEVDANHHHHHLINLKTGEVIEFESEPLEKLKRKICRDLGFEMVGERLELYGVPIDTAKPPKVRK